jgi:hypothetical protein
MKPFSTPFWAVLAAGVALAFLWLSPLDYHEARAVKMVMGLILGSFLLWLKRRSRENGRQSLPEPTHRPAKAIQITRLASLLWAGLVQITGKAGSSVVRDAGNRAQVFVDGAEVVVGHVQVDRPRHDLEKTGGKGRRSNATHRS